MKILAHAKIFILLLNFIFFSSCGYRFQEDRNLFGYRTISVPFVKGDAKGELTEAVVHEIATSGTWIYKPSCADLSLNVEVINYNEENIGFRYDRGKKGNIKHSIIPTETRIVITANVTLTEALTGKILKGPINIAAMLDFDHDYYTSRNGVNIFSLGQLSDIESAYEAALPPLYRKLAENIIEYLRNDW